MDINVEQLIAILEEFCEKDKDFKYAPILLSSGSDFLTSKKKTLQDYYIGYAKDVNSNDINIHTKDWLLYTEEESKKFNTKCIILTP